MSSMWQPKSLRSRRWLNNAVCFIIQLCKQVSLQEVLEENLKNARKIYSRFFKRQRRPLVIEMAAEYKPRPNTEKRYPSISQLR